VSDSGDPRAAFIEAAVWHGSLERAQTVLSAHPEVASRDIHTAAILGDAPAVRRFLEEDPATVKATTGPYGGDPLVYLCLSKYLRLDPSRSAAFLEAARALLDAGADPNSGFWTTGKYPEFETALYGAAGVAHHAELTRLLLERGAFPDGEVAYHTAEGYDNAAMQLIVESGRLSDESLTTLLIRKHDWHDYEGVKWLLEHALDPNRISHWGFPALHHALRRDNELRIIALLLDHGADPTLVWEGHSAIALAAREGRSDVLELLEQRRVPLDLPGVDRLIAACARDHTAAVRSLLVGEPHLRAEVLAMGGELLAKFAGTGNPAGVRQLLDLGVDVGALYAEGDGYFDIAKDSTALHIAAWRAWPAIVRLLLQRGAPVDLPDGKGRTPLALAVKACVDSYWTERRSPESVQALLDAGASVRGVDYPSGYAEVDEMLRAHGAPLPPGDSTA
jgi:ankyrin repeat protein